MRWTRIRTDNSAAYIYNTNTETVDPAGYQPGANWSTSTWYGKHTYYQQTVDVAEEDTVSTDSIKANLAIDIMFSGTPTSNITINSPYSSVTLLGNLSNVTGTTTIISGGTITQPNSSNIVEGVSVNLTAASGIGVSGEPVNVVLEGTSGRSLTATTTDGAIYINAPQTGLVINSVTAGGDQAVSLTAFGDITATSGVTGLITGGNVSITSGGIVGTLAAPIELDVGQASADQLNLTASVMSTSTRRTATCRCSR